MSIIELQMYATSNEDVELEENNEIAIEILEKIALLFPNITIQVEEIKSPTALLVQIYFEILAINYDYKPILDRLLDKYQTCKNLFLLCYLDNLCNNPNFECLGLPTHQVQENSYQVEVDSKIITVQKANQAFSDSKYQKLWKRKFYNKCFYRTYDFLKINPEYKAVLAYLPNYLTLGYYHAYLENETSIIDIARNLYFPKKEEGEKLLKGEIITKLNLQEVLKWEKFLRQNILGMNEKDYAPLGVLSYYLDYQNQNTNSLALKKDA